MVVIVEFIVESSLSPKVYVSEASELMLLIKPPPKPIKYSPFLSYNVLLGDGTSSFIQHSASPQSPGIAE